MMWRLISAVEVPDYTCRNASFRPSLDLTTPQQDKFAEVFFPAAT